MCSGNYFLSSPKERVLELNGKRPLRFQKELLCASLLWPPLRFGAWGIGCVCGVCVCASAGRPSYFRAGCPSKMLARGWESKLAPLRHTPTKQGLERRGNGSKEYSKSNSKNKTKASPCVETSQDGI